MSECLIQVLLAFKHGLSLVLIGLECQYVLSCFLEAPTHDDLDIELDALHEQSILSILLILVVIKQ